MPRISEPDEFAGRVTLEGGLRVRDREDFTRHLRALAGKVVSVSVRTWVSPGQRALYKGRILTQLAEDLGYDRDEMLDLENALLILFTHDAVRHGRRYYPRRRTSDFTEREMSLYIDFVARYAAKEYGCIVRLPEDSQ